MVVKRSAEIAATSHADDLALRALAEIVAITSDENVRIVGGQMVALLMAAFPVPGISPRRTRDADTAITTELAGSGVLHDRLIAHGWAAAAGNHYVRPVHELTVPGQPAPELSVYENALMTSSGSQRSARPAAAESVKPVQDTLIRLVSPGSNPGTCVASRCRVARSRLPNG